MLDKKSLSTNRITKSKNLTHGTGKEAYTVKYDEEGEWILPDGKKIYDVLIVSYLTEQDGNVVYDEMFLYDKFGKLDIAPKVYAVKIQTKDKTEIINITDYLKNYTPDTSLKAKYEYLVDKLYCNEDLIYKYINRDKEFNETKFFSDVKNLVTKLVEAGYINTDIKHPNLCFDNGVIKMIDFEHIYVKKISDLKNSDNDDIIDNKHFINYMIFQVFVYLRKNVFPNMLLDHVGVINELDVEKMNSNLLRINENVFKYKEHFYHPLLMINYYGSIPNVFALINRKKLNELKKQEESKNSIKGQEATFRKYYIKYD